MLHVNRFEKENIYCKIYGRSLQCQGFVQIIKGAYILWSLVHIVTIINLNVNKQCGKKEWLLLGLSAIHTEKVFMEFRIVLNNNAFCKTVHVLFFPKFQEDRYQNAAAEGHSEDCYSDARGVPSANSAWSGESRRDVHTQCVWNMRQECIWAVEACSTCPVLDQKSSTWDCSFCSGIFLLAPGFSSTPASSPSGLA